MEKFSARQGKQQAFVDLNGTGLSSKYEKQVIGTAGYSFEKAALPPFNDSVQPTMTSWQHARIHGRQSDQIPIVGAVLQNMFLNQRKGWLAVCVCVCVSGHKEREGLGRDEVLSLLDVVFPLSMWVCLWLKTLGSGDGCLLLDYVPEWLTGNVCSVFGEMLTHILRCPEVHLSGFFYLPHKLIKYSLRS